MRIFIPALIMTSCVKPIHKKKIGVIPLGSVDLTFVKIVKDSLSSVYGLNVEILKPMDLPRWAFINEKTPRYRADSLLKLLNNSSPDFDHVIGVTTSDISFTKYKDKGKKHIKEPVWKYRDFGIFGLGMRPGRASVISSYRLMKGVPTEKGMRRIALIGVHEAGHNLGLPHCPDKQCLMTDAMESIRTIDQCSGSFCNSCRDKLRW